MDLWHLYGGVPTAGLAVLDGITQPALEALWVIESAVAYRRQQEADEARAQSEAAARESRR